MLFSSGRVSPREGVAYHRNRGAAQDIREIYREEGGVGRRSGGGPPAQQRIETQQGCPLKVQGL